jgi:hypothetical protein
MSSGNRGEIDMSDTWTAWLIEDTGADSPVWWCAESDEILGSWVKDATEATCFARREDAESIMRYTGLSGAPGVHATEHGFGI